MKSAFKHLFFYIYILLHQRKMRCDKVPIQYMFIRSKNKKGPLIVVFSAYNKKRAGYNYIKTLSTIKCDKLFIKDNFGSDRLGTYYLGFVNKSSIEKAVLELVGTFSKKRMSRRIIFIGSSKGGYAALNFFLLFHNCDKFAIVGAPQYLLGSHLMNEGFSKMLIDICGSIDEKTLNELDYKIKKELINYNAGGHLFLHYSSNEQYYSQQIEPLINDLQKSKLNYSLDVANYYYHSDVHKCFPHYILKCLKELGND